MTAVVYFLRDPATRRVKIGSTCRLQVRLRTLRRVVGRDLELAATAPGGYLLEQGFHGLLLDLHLGGEWFRPDPRLDALIIGVRQGWVDLAKLETRRSPIRSAIAIRRWQATRRASAEAVA